MERGDVGLALPREMQILLIRKAEHLEETERITIPPQHIEVTHQIMMFIAGVKAHRVVGNVATGRTLTQNLDLRAVERDNLIRREAPERKPMCWVRFRGGQIGQLDFIEAAILHTPENIAPGLVECRYVAVALVQPEPERIARSRREALNRIVAAILIVGLPADDARMLAVTLRDRARDPRRLLAISRMAEAIMPPRAEPPQAPLPVERDHIWHGVDQPFGRGGRGRTHDDAQACLMENIYRIIEPLPVIPTRLRLYPAPCKFANPNAG